MIWMKLIKWVIRIHKNSREDDYLINPKTEAVLIKKMSILGFSIWGILTCILFPLYYARDTILPQFFFDLAHHLKYETFFDRYQYLIEQGGLAFADRFFIAYGLVLTINVVFLIINLPLCYILLRRNMIPLKRATKKIKWRFVGHIFVVLFFVCYLWTVGNGLNQTGFFRANERYIIMMLFNFGAGLPGISLFIILPIMKVLLSAYDAWRTKTFREVFFSHT